MYIGVICVIDYTVKPGGALINSVYTNFVEKLCSYMFSSDATIPLDLLHRIISVF